MKQRFKFDKAYLLTLWDLFRHFLEFGLFTFGGGMSIVAQIQKVYVEERHSLKSEDILDLVSVGRSIPGTMVGNVSVMFGYHMAGVPGGIVCLLGMTTPPFIVLSVITYFYVLFSENQYIISAMSGVRSAVVPIIGCAIAGMVKGAFPYKPCIFVTVLTFALYYFFNVNCAYIVVIGIAAGFIICGANERKGAVK